MQFKDQVCVVTGGANGIGRTLVQGFLEQGAKVAFIDLDEQKGRVMETQLQAQGFDVFFYAGDLSVESVLNDFAKQVIQRYSQIDFLINNACLSKKGILSGCSYDHFNYVLKVGVSAPYALTKLFLDHFKSNGAIVNISSTRAFQSQKDTESYTAAKGAITALTHALAISLSGKVRVNAVSPGWIDVNGSSDLNYLKDYSDSDIQQHPSARIGNPSDILNAVMFLCKSENSFINGQNIVVDGGMSKLMVYHDDHGWEFNS